MQTAPPSGRAPASSPPGPTDSDAALAVAARLMTRIGDEIARGGGWIPFSRFMDLAMYAPGLGYYSAGATKVGRGFGDGSDFVTAPELTPLFARALARPVAQILSAGGDTVLELGGGSGRLAADLLLQLEALDSLPGRYLLLEVSADFRQRQLATLVARAPHLAPRVEWIDRLPDVVDGAVIGNEVLDALPVEIVVWREGDWSVRGVELRDGRLTFADRPVSAALRATIDDGVPVHVRALPEYVTEVHPEMQGLVGSLVARMSPASTLLLVDYGFPAAEYYHPQRATGTLVTHRRHRAGTDLLADPGLQDITAHVDFSAVARAAEAAGGRVVGYTNQARFLIDCGIAELLTGDAVDPARWAPQVSALQTLLSEAEMGELFKAIAIARSPGAGIDEATGELSDAAIGFRSGDRRRAL